MQDLYNSKPSDLFPSRFLKAEDIGDGDLTVTIQSIFMEELGQDQDEKPVLYFAETKKGLVLNKTNCDAITKLYPGQIGDWIGKRIALYATEVSFGGKMLMGVRVRLRVPEPQASEPEPASVPQGPPNWEE
jgi:hypothetical protein